VTHPDRWCLIPEIETTTSEWRAFIRRRLTSPWPSEQATMDQKQLPSPLAKTT
jgi:hypothetical protein